MPPGTIAWAEHLEAATAYNKHHDQDAETVARRGGFGYAELIEWLGHEPTTWLPREAGDRVSRAFAAGASWSDARRSCQHPEPTGDETTPSTEELAAGYAAIADEHNGEARARRTAPSDLDGATEPGPEMAWPATPGEFAARWNAMMEERRVGWLSLHIDAMQRLDRYEMAPCESEVRADERARVLADVAQGVAAIFDASEPCVSEAHTWSTLGLSPDRYDAAWLRCKKVGPHDEHEDGTFGFKWQTAVSPDCRVGKCRACAGQALDETTDEVVACRCRRPDCAHRSAS